MVSCKTLYYITLNQTNVAMASEMLQQFDFSQSAFGENLFAKDIGNLLDGDTLVRLCVDCGTIRRRSNCQMFPFEEMRIAMTHANDAPRGGGPTYQTIP